MKFHTEGLDIGEERKVSREGREGREEQGSGNGKGDTSKEGGLHGNGVAKRGSH